MDPKTAIVIDELIRQLTIELNITTIVNTHDMNSVMEIGDNVILLYQGEIAWRGNLYGCRANSFAILGRKAMAREARCITYSWDTSL